MMYNIPYTRKFFWYISFFLVSKATVKFYNMKIYMFRHIYLSTHLIDTLLCVIYTICRHTCVLHVRLQTVSHIPNIKVDVAHNKDGLLQDYTMLLTGIVTIVLLGVDMF